LATPSVAQSASVPACSRWVAEVEYPPSPTQKAEYVCDPAAHVAAGWTQVAETLVKWRKPCDPWAT
jgi:hypothetical protein